MSLITYDLFGKKRDKVEEAIKRFKAFEPEDGYYLAFSGGKDSQCIYHLAQMAGVKFEAHYHVTSVDPPELVRFIKRQYPDVAIDFPRDKDGKVMTMWNLIPKKLMPPTRLVRYCCAAFKETGGTGRIVVTGVRHAESARRKETHGVITMPNARVAKTASANGANFTETVRGGVILNLDNDAERRTVEQCFRTNKTMLNPIVDWLDEDVWDFLNNVAKVPHCELYDHGYKRLGCIGCPMASNREAELERYPKYKAHYMRAFARMLEERDRRGKTDAVKFTSPQAVMDWYLEKTPPGSAKVDGQIGFDEAMEGYDE